MEMRDGIVNRIRQKDTLGELVSERQLTYILLTLWALMVLFPFYWMLLTSSVKSYGSYNAERIRLHFSRCHPPLENYRNAFTAVPLMPDIF